MFNFVTFRRYNTRKLARKGFRAQYFNGNGDLRNAKRRQRRLPTKCSILSHFDVIIQEKFACKDFFTPYFNKKKREFYMKKSAKSILIFGIILVVALSLAILNACDKTDKIDSSSDEHKHTYGEWSVITAATCTTDGSKKRACTICKKEETEIISAIGHSYGNWTTVTEATCTTGGQKKRTCSVCEYEETENISALGHDEIRHEAKAATCTESGYDAYVTCSRCDYTTFDEIPALGHNFVDDVCERCQDVLPTTEGLSYSLSADETSYTVVGIGTATDTEIVIPSRYNGLPVTNIGGGAFLSCNSMTSITIPAGVTSIEMGAFDDCSGLTTIYYRGNIASWCGIRGLDNVMSSTRSLYIDGTKVEGALVIPDGASKIEEFAFVGCCGITSVTVGNGVASIGRGAFMSCEDITQITIDNAAISIDAFAFAYCNKLTSITYNGTTAQWENVTKGENWVYGTNITVHCTDGDVTVA